MSDTLERMRQEIRRREERAKAVQFSVLLWGPGTEPYLAKRRQIADALGQIGFEAHLGEDLVKALPSTLGTVEHEDVQWQQFDLVLVLDFGPGPGFELALYSHDPRLVNKAIICHRREWDPSGSSLMGSGVLELFHNRWPAEESEITSCDILTSFVLRAKAFRRSYLPQNLA